MTTDRGQELVKGAAPLAERPTTPPQTPTIDDTNRFALMPISVERIHAAAAILGTDASTVANGAAQYYHFIADLVSKGWVIAGIDPDDGQTRPIEWSGFDKIQPSRSPTHHD